MKKLYTSPVLWEIEWVDVVMASTPVSTLGGVSNVGGEGVFDDFFGN